MVTKTRGVACNPRVLSMASATCTGPAIGICFAPARHGHRATSFREDWQPVAEAPELLKSRGGCPRPEQVLTTFPRQHPNVHSCIYVGGAGQCATNLQAGRVLRLLHEYPTTERIGRATLPVPFYCPHVFVVGNRNRQFAKATRIL